MCGQIIAAHATGISILALIISAFALGWNVYRDIILKPRLRIEFYLAGWANFANGRWPEFQLSIVNVGPGNITVEMPVIEVRSGFLNRHSLIQGVAKLMPECYSRYDARNFQQVEVGEKVVFKFPTKGTRSVLDLNPWRIGIRDSLGRNHWATRRDLEKARREYAAPEKSGVKLA